ncbi:M48 family metalloprotease [Sedimenticola hydrogenitrophicus]|uniref:M48 family metalloprotease n=1 Tax=Sedimenticola hydrogenitrophicus TaxID=2967975 RepID=UPI0021A43993|nr:M48 family metalloprotease [Sedimenticola hydrogenitrophicus]
MTPSLLAALVITGLLLQLWLHGRELRYQQRQSAQAGARSSDYSRQRLRFAALGLVFEALFVLLMLAAGLELLQRLWLAAGLSGWALQWALLLSVLLLLAAVQRAITLLRVWCVERRFGYSRQRLGGFFRDTLVKAGLLLIVGSGLAAGATRLLEAGWPAGWWSLALLWGGFVWVRSWLYPALIAPLFNRYRPVDDPDLVCRVGAIGRQAGIDLGPLLVMDGSRRSSHGNAHVTGTAGSRRVVLLDTLSGILDTGEIAAVVGHEAGHLRARHMPLFQFCSLLVSTLWIGLFSLAAGTAELAPGTGLALLWLLTPNAALLVKPLFSCMIRGFEHQADAFAGACGYADALACALVKLTRHNGAAEDSDPWFSLVYHSHPRLAERLRRLGNTKSFMLPARS